MMNMRMVKKMKNNSSYLNTYSYLDYVTKDKEEELLKQNMLGVPNGTPAYRKLDNELDNLMCENRGINISKKDVYVDSLILSKYILSRMRIIKVLDSLYVYNIKEHHYENIAVDTLASFIMKIICEYNEEYYTAVNESTVLIYINRKVKTLKELRETSGYIIMKNGIYDIRANTFKNKFNRKIFRLSSLDYEYDKNATCPQFLAFLDDIFSGDKKLIKLMQQVFGYTFLYGEVKTHKIFYLAGNGRNGKSVLAKLLIDLHNEKNVGAVFLDELCNRFTTSSLVGKVVNISPEGKQSKLLDTAMIKALTAGDTIMIERKYHDSYPAQLTTKFIILSNHPLRTDDDSFGFQQRIITIPFKKQYHELPSDGVRKSGLSYQDPDLYDKLKTELPGIFNWAIEGLKDLQKHNWTFTECKAARELSQKFMLQNKPIRLFYESCIEVVDDSNAINSSQIFDAFKKWTRNNNILSIGYDRRAEFHEEFRKVMEQENHNSETRLRNGYSHYYGIKLKNDYKNYVIYT